MGECDLTMIHERLARLESSDQHQAKQIKEIHKVLVGNGQPGLVAEWNQWKGGIKTTYVIFGSILTIISVAVGILAYVK